MPPLILNFSTHNHTAKLAGLLLGLLYPLGFAPFDLWPITLISIGGFYQLLLYNTAPNTRQNRVNPALFAFKLGFFYGIGVFIGGIHWVNISIHVYGGMPLLVSLFMTLLFILFLSFVQFSCLGYVFTKLSAHHSPKMVFTMLWICVECFRGHAFTGFPWLLAGYSLTETYLAQFAPLIGIYGLSLLCVITATLSSTLLSTSYSALHKFSLVCLLLMLTVAGKFIGHIQWTTPSPSKDLTVALVQGNIDQNDKWNKDFFIKTLKIYERQSRKLFQSHSVDLLIWPEAAIPSFYHETWRYIDMIHQLSLENNAAWLTGVPKTVITKDNQILYYNSLIAKGQATGEYHKHRLVPFGEFIPFSSWLRTLGPFFNLPMSDFSQGPQLQPPLLAQDTKISPHLCYEIAFPDSVRKAAKNSDLLLTLSNDAWFGHSVAPHQHFQIARMRALETGRMLIRATNTGITGIINQKGAVIKTAPSFEETTLVGQVTPFSGETPYMRWGNTPIFLCLSFWIILILTNFTSRAIVRSR